MPKIAGRDRKQELLESARDLIFTEGATRFTIRRLAERVKISEAAVYRHFESKEALLLHLVETLFQGWEDSIESILQSRETASARLRELARFHLDYLLNRQFNPILLLSDATDPNQKALQAKLQSIAQALRGSISVLLREGKSAGEFAADLHIATGAAVFLGGIQSVVLQWTLTQRSEPLHRELRNIVEHLLRGYRLPAASPTDAKTRLHAGGKAAQRTPSRRSSHRLRSSDDLQRKVVRHTLAPMNLGNSRTTLKRPGSVTWRLEGAPDPLPRRAFRDRRPNGRENRPRSPLSIVPPGLIGRWERFGNFRNLSANAAPGHTHASRKNS